MQYSLYTAYLFRKQGKRRGVTQSKGLELKLEPAITFTLAYNAPLPYIHLQPLIRNRVAGVTVPTEIPSVPYPEQRYPLPLAGSQGVPQPRSATGSPPSGRCIEEAREASALDARTT